MKFRTQYETAPRIVLHMPEDEICRVKPEFKDECDINLIMKRYKATGQLPQSALSAAQRFGDFSQIPDFMEMQHRVIAAHELFDALPAAVRKQFDNNPGQFISASETPEGRELLVKLGLGKEIQSPSNAPLSSSNPPLEASSSSSGQDDAPPAQTPAKTKPVK